MARQSGVWYFQKNKAAFLKECFGIDHATD